MKIKDKKQELEYIERKWSRLDCKGYNCYTPMCSLFEYSDCVGRFGYKQIKEIYEKQKNKR